MTTSQKNSKAKFRVLPAHLCGIDNYPSSDASAIHGIETLIATQLADGYKYHGSITRNVIGEDIEFFIFYLV